MPQKQNISSAEAVIRAHIAARGAISVADFMDVALAHPAFGYYMTRDPFGVQGDFTTAPEISQMFGEVIGAWVADLWIQMGRPSPFFLIECGAGRGTLIRDLWRATARVAGFHDAARVHVVEISPVLRALQKDNCAGLPLAWHDSLDSVEAGHPCVILGNEFLDALPVDQVALSQRGWQKRVITIHPETNRFGFDFVDDVDIAVDKFLSHPKRGVVYEVSRAQKRFIDSCAAYLKKGQGVALFIDYGYTQNRGGDTVQALYKHAPCAITEHIGHADITAHVDFGFILREAQRAGLRPFGAVGQGDFLRRLGIAQRAQVLRRSAGDSPEKIKDIDAALERLTSPRQMGDLFKVIALSANDRITPAGFEVI